jgi:hypothetical protein
VGCPKPAATGGTPHCAVHGGGSRCQTEGCSKQARSRGAPHCIVHGGGKRCKTQGCCKAVAPAAGSEYCVKCTTALALIEHNKNFRPPRGPWRWDEYRGASGFSP